MFDFIVRPEISVTSPATALEGDNVNFHCTVTAANPLATVMWLGPTTKVLSSGPHLTLNSVNRNQGGEYSCIASNGISPNASKTAYLSVNCKYKWVCGLLYFDTIVEADCLMYIIGNFYITICCKNL